MLVTTYADCTQAPDLLDFVEEAHLPSATDPGERDFAKSSFRNSRTVCKWAKSQQLWGFLVCRS